MLIANDIYTEKQGLIGSQCQNCEEYLFPQVSSCSNCSDQSIKPVSLGHHGHLWSWTIQQFMPKAPYASGETLENFTPYGVGLIEMECGLIIKSRVKLSETPLEIGQKMELHITAFGHSDEGVVDTYEFHQSELA